MARTEAKERRYPVGTGYERPGTRLVARVPRSSGSTLMFPVKVAERDLEVLQLADDIAEAVGLSEQIDVIKILYESDHVLVVKSEVLAYMIENMIRFCVHAWFSFLNSL